MLTVQSFCPRCPSDSWDNRRRNSRRAYARDTRPVVPAVDEVGVTTLSYRVSPLRCLRNGCFCPSRRDIGTDLAPLPSVRDLSHRWVLPSGLPTPVTRDVGTTRVCGSLKVSRPVVPDELRVAPLHPVSVFWLASTRRRSSRTLLSLCRTVPRVTRDRS